MHTNPPAIDEVKERGVVFTPSHICDFMVSFINNNKTYNKTETKLRILEPSCGEGAFLQSILGTMAGTSSTLEGNDINEHFVTKCREQFPSVKFSVQDFLQFDKSQVYDIIIGNPPYVRIQNLTQQDTNAIRLEYPTLISGNLDLYVYFILKCVDMLSEHGKLIFIIPNSFLYNKSCRKVKDHLIKNGLLEYVIDFREKKIFNKFSIYTCIIVINKQNSNKRTFYNFSTNMEGKYEKIMYEKQVLQNSLLNYINVKNGIATLCDDVFIIHNGREDESYVYFKKRDKEYKIEKCITKKILKVSKNQVKYIITPYIFGADGGCRVMDDLSSVPYCQEYMLENQDKLNNRDKGKKKYEKWFAFGRKQGLECSNARRYFISSLTPCIRGKILVNESPLFYSGLCLEIKQEFRDTLSYEKLIEILHKHEETILSKANVKSNGWYSLSKSCFEIDVELHEITNK